MSAQEKAAARDAILAAERLSDESSAVRVVRAICVTCLAVGSVTCILVALLGPRTSSMKIPLLSAPLLAQLTLDDSLRKPSNSAPPPPPRVRKAHAANAAKANPLLLLTMLRNPTMTRAGRQFARGEQDPL